MGIDFKGKKILVGAATNGIGLATAKLFAGHGARITIIGRNKNKLTATVKLLKQINGLQHDYIEVDFEHTGEIQKKLSDYLQHNQGFDVVVNNVGGPYPKKISSITIDDLLKYYKIQFLSLFVITGLTLNYMKKRKSGRIINIVGTVVKHVIPDLAISVGKSNIVYWAKNLSEEVGKYNITVNNIFPGPTDTNELNKILKYYAGKEHKSVEEVYKEVAETTALKRIAKPEEIARMVLITASDYASYVTGSNIFVDGGYSKSIY